MSRELKAASSTRCPKLVQRLRGAVVQLLRRIPIASHIFLRKERLRELPFDPVSGVPNATALGSDRFQNAIPSKLGLVVCGPGGEPQALDWESLAKSAKVSGALYRKRRRELGYEEEIP